VMRSLLRAIYNFLYKSAHRFDDGSALYYNPVHSIVRYYTGESIRRIADIPVIYDESSGIERIDTTTIWRWREPEIPLNAPSNSGPPLSANERSELLQKLQVFVAQAPRWFEALKG
jgi:hypothetical protein